jgi:septal ring factor EnvC (AmiA/AmiB activator)
MNFRPSFSSASAAAPATATNGSPDDQRKKQIRDSNREAARRCRERRRQYIEQLEGNLEHHKVQIKQLTDKLARIERENTQLRAILTETKVLHPSSRLSVNESHVDYANIVAATGMDLNSESNHQTDGGIIQRNYLNRNNL